METDSDPERAELGRSSIGDAFDPIVCSAPPPVPVTYAAGPVRPYGYRIDFARQRCTRGRLRVGEAPAAAYCEGHSMGLTRDVGVMPGGNRPQQRQMGAR